MTVGELIFELGFKADTIKLNEFVEDIGKLNLSSVLASVGVKELYDGMKNIMDVADQMAVSMNLFGRVTGLSFQKMQQWKNYAEQMGVSGDAVTSTLEALQKKMADYKLYQDPSILTYTYLLNQAGAAITNADLNDPFSFLNKALVALQRMDPLLRTTIAGKLGIQEQLLAINNFNAANSLDVPSPSQLNRLMQYHSVMTSLGQTIKQTFVDIASYFSDDFKDIGNVINTIIKSFHNLEPLREIAKILLTVAEASISIMFPWTRIPLLIEWTLHSLRDLKNFWDSEKKPHGSNFDVSKAHHLGTPEEMNGYLSGIFGNRFANAPNSSNSTTVNQKNDININSNDPHATAHQVREALGNFINDADKQRPKSST